MVEQTAFWQQHRIQVIEGQYGGLKGRGDRPISTGWSRPDKTGAFAWSSRQFFFFYHPLVSGCVSDHLEAPSPPVLPSVPEECACRAPSSIGLVAGRSGALAEDSGGLGFISAALIVPARSAGTGRPSPPPPPPPLRLPLLSPCVSSPFSQRDDCTPPFRTNLVTSQLSLSAAQ